MFRYSSRVREWALCCLLFFSLCMGEAYEGTHHDAKAKGSRAPLAQEAPRYNDNHRKHRLFPFLSP